MSRKEREFSFSACVREILAIVRDLDLSECAILIQMRDECSI